jgi:integrase
LADPSRALAVAPAAVDALLALEQRAREYADNARAASTRRAYTSDFDVFEQWCSSQGLCAMPAAPATVALYLTARAQLGRSVSNIQRHLTSIAQAHRANGLPWPRSIPALAEIMAGIRRKLGIAPKRQKDPVLLGELRALVGALPTTTQGHRDRAVLTVGWWGAFRRAELAALDVADVQRAPEGMIVTVRRSKEDQDGEGMKKGIPYAADPAICPVRALARWLEIAAIAEGPIFRRVGRYGHVGGAALNDKSVALIVQRSAERAGLDPENLAGHSLRAGFATQAAARGKGLDEIMKQTGHRSEKVARRYIRNATAFQGNAAVGLE